MTTFERIWILLHTACKYSQYRLTHFNPST